MITRRKMDITTVVSGVIVHGCNAQGVMGSGVARALRNKWPQIYDPYRRMCDKERYSQRLLGEVCPVDVSDDPTLPIYVLNGITQQLFGADGKPYADINAIRSVLKKSMDFASQHELDLYLPEIGCGLGGLKWDDVQQVMHEVHAECANPPTVKVCVL